MYIFNEKKKLISIQAGFTLIELLVVIVIISILAAVSAGGVKRAKEMARQSDCMSNLRQFGVAIVAYRNDHAGRSPDWTSCLFPTYVDDLSIYVCRSDINNGEGPTRPKGIPDDPPSRQKYRITVDSDANDNRHKKQNKDVKANSYMYEFSCAKLVDDPDTAGWVSDIPGGTAESTWADYKEWQLREGNKNKTPFSSSRIPIVRCYHHALNSTVPALRGGTIVQSCMTINVAYAGNVVIAPLMWEEYVGPGDR